MAAELNPAFNTREDPGKWGSLALTLFIHGVLALVLFYGVQWQRKAPEPVEVELVRALPPPVPAPPRPEVTPAPPPTVPKVEPKEVEPPPVKKPDIALPKPVEKPVQKEKPPVEPPKPVEKSIEKPQPKPQEKPAEPVKPQVSARELEAQRQRDLLLMESDKTRRQMQAQATAATKVERDQAVAKVNGKAEAEWTDAIKQKVRGNLSAPPFSGNPEAVFTMELFPTGEVGTIQLQRSSGNKALDEAMERAIRSSSPLPMPSRPDVFQRNLRFVFKPRGD